MGKTGIETLSRREKRADFRVVIRYMKMRRI
jgi:hypothetical protein